MNKPVLHNSSRPDRPAPADFGGDRQALILKWIAESEALQNTPDRAMEVCQKAVSLAAESGPLFQSEYARALKQRGVVYSLFSDHDAALADFSQALKIFDSLDDHRNAAILHNLMSTLYSAEGLFPEALQGYIRALEFFENGTEPRWEADILNNMGYTYFVLGQPAEALIRLEKSMQIARDNELDASLVSTLDSLGITYLSMGDLDQAYAYIQEAVDYARLVQNEYDLSANLQSAGMVHVERNEVEQALPYFAESLELAGRRGFRGKVAEAEYKFGLAYARSGQVDEAETHLQRALSISAEIGLGMVTVQCYEELAKIHKRKGDFEQALRYHEQFFLAREAILSYQTGLRLRNFEMAREMDHKTKESEIIRMQTRALQKEVEERMKAQAAAEHLAISDSLTGVFNRRHFFDLARRELVRSQRFGHPLTLVLLDLDHFKIFNNTYGHIAGDEMLMMEAGLIRASLREGDVIGRYSGEEFILLMPETSVESARQVAERLREAIASQRMETEKGPVSVTISIGMAGSSQARPGETLSLDGLITWADQALHNAKKAGRNRIAVYYPG